MDARIKVHVEACHLKDAAKQKRLEKWYDDEWDNVFTEVCSAIEHELVADFKDFTYDELEDATRQVLMRLLEIPLTGR